MNRVFLPRRYDWKGKLFSRNHFYPLLLYDSFYPPFHLPLFPTIANSFHYTCLSAGIVAGIARKTVEQETRVHTGVKSGLPIDSSQPLVDNPPPWLTKAPLYEWNDSTPDGVSRETFTKATHPFFFFYLSLPFSRRCRAVSINPLCRCVFYDS